MKDCPRCGCNRRTYIGGASQHGDYDRWCCYDCDHCWGDGLPDSQEKPLPDGMIDCTQCEGTGVDVFDYGDGRRVCASCKGGGIVDG